MQPILTQLVKEKDSIPYAAKWNTFTGSPVATIVLRQMLYWWDIKKEQEFYKFKEPCRNSLYKEGDSWCEELGLSRRAFDTAIKKIGFKLGKRRKDAIKGDRNRKDATAENSFITYYKDSSGLTWYTLNTGLLSKVLTELYLEKSKSDITERSPNQPLQDTETTAETTNKDTNKESKSTNTPLQGKTKIIPKEVVEAKFRPAYDLYPGPKGEFWNSFTSFKRGCNEAKKDPITELDLLSPAIECQMQWRLETKGFTPEWRTFAGWLATAHWYFVPPQELTQDPSDGAKHEIYQMGLEDGSITPGTSFEAWLGR